MSVHPHFLLKILHSEVFFLCLLKTHKTIGLESSREFTGPMLKSQTKIKETLQSCFFSKKLLAV